MSYLPNDFGKTRSRTAGVCLAHLAGEDAARRVCWWSSDDVCQEAFEADAETPGLLANALDAIPAGLAYGAYSAAFFGIDLDDWLWGPADLDPAEVVAAVERGLRDTGYRRR